MLHLCFRLCSHHLAEVETNPVVTQLMIICIINQMLGEYEFLSREMLMVWKY